MKNTKITHRLLLVLLCFAVLSGACLGGGAEHDWQAGGCGPDMRSPGTHFVPYSGQGPSAMPLSCGGLAFALEFNGGRWPAHLKIGGVDFGPIALGAGEWMLADKEVDWARLELLLEGGKNAAKTARVIVSRLSPGFLIVSQGREIGLGRMPMYIALPTEDGIRIGKSGELIDQPLPWNQDEKGLHWLLCWWGKSNPVTTTTTHPMPYMAARDNDRAEFMREADIPLLFCFERPPVWLDVGEEGGARFVFYVTENEVDDDESRAGHVFVMPLYGANCPPAEDTERWAQGLPADVSERCRWWAGHAGHFPLTVREDYAYDAGADRVTVQEKIEFLSFGKDQEKFAPLPPMLAAAEETGFPVRFSGETADSGVVVYIGPIKGVIGVDEYSWSVAGLGRYTDQAQAAGKEAKEPEKLRDLLAGELEKIVSAGHLAPWILNNNQFHIDRRSVHEPYWANTGETLYYLADALKVVDDPGLRERVLGYMKEERSEYPPEQIAYNTPFTGARRERYKPSPSIGWPNVKYSAGDSGPTAAAIKDPNTPLIEWMKKYNMLLLNGLHPLESVYGLWCYYDLFPEERADIPELMPVLDEILNAYLANLDWASLGWFRWGNQPQYNSVTTQDEFRGGMGAVLDANRMFSALVGYIRMAKWCGDAEREIFGRGLLARTAALRYACSGLVRFRYKRGIWQIPSADPAWQVKGWVGMNTLYPQDLFTHHFAAPEDDVRVVWRMDEFERNLVMTSCCTLFIAPFFRDATPELARFLGDTMKPTIRRTVERIEENLPDWYMALGESVLSGDGRNYLPPDNALQNFLARAWVLGTPAEELARYCDVPYTERGDLYYICKLVQAIKAYRGVEWEVLK